MRDELTGAWRRLADLQARIAHDDAAAGGELDALWETVDAAGSVPGRALVAAMQCTCMHVQRRDFRRHALWRRRLDEALLAGWPALAPADALRVLIGAGWAGQITPLAALPPADIVGRIGTLLDGAEVEAGDRASLCLHAAATAARLSGHFDDVAMLEAFVGRAGRFEAAADAAARVDWLQAAGTALLFLVPDTRGQRMLQQARELAAAAGLRAALFEISHDEYFIRLGREGPDGLDALFEQMLTALDPARLFDVARRYHLQARRALHDVTQSGAAFYFGRTAVDLMEQSGYPIGDSAMVHTTFAYACARHGDVAAGLAAIERVAAQSSGVQQRQQRSLALFLRAYSQLRNEPLDQSRALLQQAFAEARELEWFGFRPVPDVAGSLVEAALRLDIEAAAYARKLVVQRRLSPPGYSDAWPWRLRLVTLGRFEVTHDGAPLARSGKVPRKTLELLQYLAGSPQLNVAADRLTAALWPDLEGDLARGAFRTALHRLRKLLVDAEAVQFDGISVWLDPDHVWVDVLAFERLVDATEKHLRRDEGVRGREAGSEAFALYHGHFLADQPEAGWILAAQGRLRSRFVRLVLLLGEQVARTGDAAQAIQLYRKAIELDPLDEELARRLMALLRDRGEASAALEVFRALRQRLSIELGQPPSAQTQRLADSLRD
jgi:DNA-binding SARP family transcriptional activator